MFEATIEAEMAGAKRVAIDDVKAIVSFMVDGVSNYAIVLCVCAASLSSVSLPIVFICVLQPPFEISTLLRVIMRRLLGL